MSASVYEFVLVQEDAKCYCQEHRYLFLHLSLFFIYILDYL